MLQSARQQAFTLIELIICLAIMGIVIGYVAPTMGVMVKRSRAISAVNWVVVAVNFTRDAAITRNQVVTLCPSSTGKSCGGSWDIGAIAFTDANMNRHIDGQDVLLRHFQFPIKGASLTWHAFRNRHYLQMTGEGFTNYENGHFLYCPPNRDPKFADQMIVNMQGRVRLATDRNGDGIVEDARGHDISCRSH